MLLLKKSKYLKYYLNTVSFIKMKYIFFIINNKKNDKNT